MAEIVHYRMVGQYDQLHEVKVSPEGNYSLQRGSYVSATPVAGKMASSQLLELHAALDELGPGFEAPIPAESGGFVSELWVGEGSGRRHYKWWGNSQPNPAIARVLDILKGL